MTASIHINKYWLDGGKSFEMWLRAYGFNIIDKNADVIIIDYQSWKNTNDNYSDDSLIVILASYETARRDIPLNALFVLVPVDYHILIEDILELLDSKKQQNNYYKQ